MKKSIALALTLPALLTLTACGGGASSAGGDEYIPDSDTIVIEDDGGSAPVVETSGLVDYNYVRSEVDLIQAEFDGVTTPSEDVAGTVTAENLNDVLKGMIFPIKTNLYQSSYDKGEFAVGTDMAAYEDTDEAVIETRQCGSGYLDLGIGKVSGTAQYNNTYAGYNAVYAFDRCENTEASVTRTGSLVGRNDSGQNVVEYESGVYPAKYYMYFADVSGSDETLVSCTYKQKASTVVEPYQSVDSFSIITANDEETEACMIKTRDDKFITVDKGFEWGLVNFQTDSWYEYGSYKLHMDEFGGWISYFGGLSVDETIERDSFGNVLNANFTITDSSTVYAVTYADESGIVTVDGVIVARFTAGDLTSPDVMVILENNL